MVTPDMRAPSDLDARPPRCSVSEAIERRQSIRTFLADPIDRKTIVAILEQASRSPSNGNLQPWSVHVVAGEKRRTITDRCLAMVAAGNFTDKANPVSVYPPSLWEPYRTRRRTAGAERYSALGYFDKDLAGMTRLVEMNCDFFYAPIGLFFYINDRMERHQWCDLGMYIQNVMLLAVEQGLDTCPQAFWTNWSSVISEALGVADDMSLVAGMSLGKRDPNNSINQYKTERAPIEAFAKLHGI